MDTLREQGLMRLVDGALTLPTEARAAFLDEHCQHDAEMRAEAEAMLACDAATGALGATQIAEGLREYVARTSWHARPGEVIGRYRLGSEIGSGGMGTVFAAEQASPRRQVALKLMHGRLVGTDSGQRFSFESEVLARLSHPNVAQVLEAGAHEVEPGVLVPWFAMELVEGARTLTQFAREHALPLRDRLRLLCTVCDAVHHGHQQGVIHRDLKPANVLVDGRGRVKVIDFSIAAATNRAEALTMLTRTGDLLGTLPYMSPEQVSGPRDDVDTRADVYALGVLLFELATDQLPIDMTELSLAESVRRVVEQPARRPGALRAGLPRELDWIALKALEKQPGRRYASASELQSDVERLLAGQDVHAGQPSRVYLASKAVRRHPVLSSVAGLVLIGSFGFGSYQSRVADDQRVMAREQARLKDEAVELTQRALVRQSEAHVLAAGVASEQGHWEAVVDSLDQALALDVGDPIALGFRRLSAFVAMGDYTSAEAAIAALEDQPGSTAHIGRLLYYRALIQLADRDEREDGLALLEAAVGHSLPAADAAFARGMTARISGLAVAAFREAIALDAAHPLAWSGLLNALVASGQLREARRVADALSLRLRRDKRVHAYRVLFAVIAGEPEAMEAAFDDARPWLSEAEQRQLPILGHWIGDVDQLLGRMLEDGGKPSLGFLTKAMGLLASPERQAEFDEELLVGAVSMHQRFIADSFAGLAGMNGLSGILSNLLQARYDTIVQQLNEVILINPNPILLFIRALVRTFAESADYEALVADYTAAAEELDLLPNVVLFARFGVLGSRMNAWRSRRDAESARHVVDAIGELERHKDIYPSLLESMARTAEMVGAPDRSRAILDRWQRAQPDDLAPLRLRVAFELDARNWWAARTAIRNLADSLPVASAERTESLLQLADVDGRLRQAILGSAGSTGTSLDAASDEP